MLQLLLNDAALQCRLCLMTSWAAQAWIRRRAKQGGMPRPEAVRLVSALRGTGVDELLIQLHREVGTNGDVWVVRCHAPLDMLSPLRASLLWHLTWFWHGCHAPLDMLSPLRASLLWHLTWFWHGCHAPLDMLSPLCASLLWHLTWFWHGCQS